MTVSLGAFYPEELAIDFQTRRIRLHQAGDSLEDRRFA
jgi:hypothetical protein